MASRPSSWILLVISLLLVSCGQPASTAERLADLGGQLCSPDSEFTCVTVNVPLDHTDPSDVRSVGVTFAVKPAVDDPDGVLVVAVGGPGSSGVEEAVWRFADLPVGDLDDFDLVFFDLRGVGEFEHLDCPEADRAFGEGGGLTDDVIESWGVLVAEIETHRSACFEDMGSPQELAYLDTDQAVEDLEVFRQVMDYDKLIIYGESYGTAFAQTYASTHPQSVERLVLDGTIDLTLDAIDIYRSRIQALEDVVSMLSDACDIDPACASDMGMPMRDIFDDLVATLEAGPVSVEYPVARDVSEVQMVTADEIVDLAFDSVYASWSRMEFLRAMAAYARSGDLVPILQLRQSDSVGEGVSDIIFEAVTCRDFSTPGETAEEEAEAILDAIKAVPSYQRWQFMAPLWCVFWPYADHAKEPAGPFTGQGIPTLVIASEGDPATPYRQSVSVFESLDDGYLLTVRGGTHVMFGAGVACVDELVVEFISSGSAPHESACAAEVFDPYVPLPQNPPHIETD